MNLELVPDVRRRARLHAVLADPTRLAIVDTLRLGDAAPSELQHALHVPSNLLAHHVKILETEGLITRSRSEADRRRSYLQLVPGVFDVRDNGAQLQVPRIVFVCTANSARSQLAAALWRRASSVPVASAGTHPAARIDARAVAAARRHGLTLRARRPRPIDEIVSNADLIVTVCDHAHEELSDHRALHWSISDPVPKGTDAAFDAAHEELSRRVTVLAPYLQAS